MKLIPYWSTIRLREKYRVTRKGIVCTGQFLTTNGSFSSLIQFLNSAQLLRYHPHYHLLSYCDGQRGTYCTRSAVVSIKGPEQLSKFFNADSLAFFVELVMAARYARNCERLSTRHQVTRGDAQSRLRDHTFRTQWESKAYLLSWLLFMSFINLAKQRTQHVHTHPYFSLVGVHVFPFTL